jgi:hypothetical protein
MPSERSGRRRGPGASEFRGGAARQRSPRTRRRRACRTLAAARGPAPAGSLRSAGALPLSPQGRRDHAQRRAPAKRQRRVRANAARADLHPRSARRVPGKRRAGPTFRAERWPAGTRRPTARARRRLPERSVAHVRRSRPRFDAPQPWGIQRRPLISRKCARSPPIPRPQRPVRGGARARPPRAHERALRSPPPEARSTHRGTPRGFARPLRTRLLPRGPVQRRAPARTDVGPGGAASAAS